MPQKVPVQIWAHARRAGASDRARRRDRRIDTAVDHRPIDRVHAARAFIERGDGRMVPGDRATGVGAGSKPAPARRLVFAPKGNRADGVAICGGGRTLSMA